MNKCVDVIFHLEFTKMTRYTATYEKFLELAEINKNQHINAYEKQREFIKKQEDFIAKNKARYSTTGRAKSRQNNSIVWSVSIVLKQLLSLSSPLKKVVQVVALSSKGKMWRSDIHIRYYRN